MSGVAGPPGGAGSVAGVPQLPPGFADTFTSQYVQAGELQLHAVTGGAGPPLLLLGGWPQTWYAVQGREDVFFGHQFASKAASPGALPAHAVEVYVDAIANRPDALRASFEFYRALDTTMEQNGRRSRYRLALPVLTIAGAQGSGELVEQTMRRAAEDVQSVVLPDCGHYPAEEAPEAVLAALAAFLAPYRA